jgi:hypothetical protein
MFALEINGRDGSVLKWVQNLKTDRNKHSQIFCLKNFRNFETLILMEEEAKISIFFEGAILISHLID